MSDDISSVVPELILQVRSQLDPLGYADGAHGAFRTGHVTHVGPFAYLATVYAGLSDEGIAAAEAECDRYIPETYRSFLRHTNGLWLGELSLHGTINCQAYISGPGIGQPVSLIYQNIYERPEYIPAGHLGIGAVNGAHDAQGHLYLTSTGEVEMYHRDADLIGARWTSFAAFLQSEIARQLSLYDAQGKLRASEQCLPGKTENWEELAAKASKERRRRNRGIGKIAGLFTK